MVEFPLCLAKVCLGCRQLAAGRSDLGQFAIGKPRRKLLVETCIAPLCGIEIGFRANHISLCLLLIEESSRSLCHKLLVLINALLCQIQVRSHRPDTPLRDLLLLLVLPFLGLRVNQLRLRLLDLRLGRFQRVLKRPGINFKKHVALFDGAVRHDRDLRDQTRDAGIAGDHIIDDSHIVRRRRNDVEEQDQRR